MQRTQSLRCRRRVTDWWQDFQSTRCSDWVRDWFAGAVVAYSSEVKHRPLEVPRGSVISQVSVDSMVRSVCSLLGADAAVAASGVGGPTGQDGHDLGTTWIAVLVGGDAKSEHHRFSVGPIEILAQPQEQALAMLLEALLSRYGSTSVQHEAERSADGIGIDSKARVIAGLIDQFSTGGEDARF